MFWNAEDRLKKNGTDFLNMYLQFVSFNLLDLIV